MEPTTMGITRPARINVPFLIALTLIVGLLTAGAIGGHYWRTQVVATQALDAARAAAKEKKWDEAVKQYKTYLDKNPNDLDAVREYAAARLSIKPLDPRDISAAERSYRQVIQLEPDDVEAYRVLARIYLFSRNYDELEYIARQKLQRVPEDPQATVWLAKALTFKRDLTRAREALEPLIKRLEAPGGEPDPQYVPACVWLSVIAAQGPNGPLSDDVLAWLDRAVERVPNSADALARRAHFYRQRAAVVQDAAQREEYTRMARADLEKIEGMGEVDPIIALTLCEEWIALRDFDKVVAAARRLDEADPGQAAEPFLDDDDWHSARFLLEGEFALRRGAGQEGAALADKALGRLLQPRHRVMILPRAVELYVLADNAEAARKCLDEFLGLWARLDQPSSREEIAYLKAIVARAESDSYAVIDLLQPISEQANAPARVWALLSEAFSRTNQPRRSLEALKKYVQMEPRDADARMQLVRQLAAQRQWSEALQVARLADSSRRADVELTLLRIESGLNVAVNMAPAARKAGLEKLAQELAELRRRDPQRVEVRVLASMVELGLEHPDAAVETLRQAIREVKDSLPAELQLARLHYSLQKPEDAVRVASEACQRHPENAQAWRLKAELLQALGQPEQTIKTLQDALAAVKDRNELRALGVELASLELAAGDEAQAVQRLRALAAEEPRDLSSRALLLSAPSVRKDVAKAQAIIDEMKKSEGESGVQWRFQQAALWLDSPDWRGRQSEILALLTRCVEADQGWSAPVLLLGATRERLGQTREAELVYRSALEANPRASDVADRLLVLLNKQSRYDEAQQLLNQVQFDPALAEERRLTLAIESGNYASALTALRERVKADPADVDSRVLLARLLYRQNKDSRGALALLDEAESIGGVNAVTVGSRVAILSAEKHDEEAEAALDAFVAAHDGYDSRMLRARYHANANRLENAATDFAALLERPGDLRSYEAAGAFEFERGRPDDGIAVWQAGLAKLGDVPSLQRRLARALLERDQGDDRRLASSLLDALEAKAPHDVELLQLRAAALFAEGTPAARARATTVLEQLVQLQPKAVDAHLALITQALREHRFPAAREMAIRALAANGEEPRLLLARARAELALNATSAARQLARTVAERDPQSIEALVLLADISQAGGAESEMQQALDVINRAMAADARPEELRLARARLLVALKREAEARADLQSLIESNNATAASWIFLADLERAAGHHDQALQLLEQAETRLGPDPGLLRGKILLLGATGAVDAVARSLSGERPDPPFSAQVLLTGASVLLRSPEQKPLVKAILDDAAARTLPGEDVRFDVAGLMYQAGAVEKAIALYREGLAARPEAVRALNDLAYILAESGQDLREALNYADRGVQIAPEFAALRDTRGGIYARLPDRLVEARRDFEKCVTLSASAAERGRALLQLGAVCARMKDPVAARRHLSEAQKLDREGKFFDEAQKAELARWLAEVGGSAAAP